MTPSARPRPFLKAVFSPANRIILVCILFSVGLYFWGYTSPAHHADLRADTVDLRYVINFLSNLYQYRSTILFVVTKSVTAILLVAMVGFFSARVLRLVRGRVSWEWTHCIGLTCFLVGLAFLSSIGRGGAPKGALYALSERYNSISILFSILVCVCLALAFGYASVDPSRQNGKGSMPLLGWQRFLVFGTVVIFLAHGVRANENWRPLILAHFSGRQVEMECMRSYVSSQAKGVDEDLLGREASCASRLYPRVETISGRFSGLWCDSAPMSPSATIRDLCHFFNSKSHPITRPES